MTYTATVLPAPGGVGFLSIETSADGTTWTEYQLLSNWTSSSVIGAPIPVGATEPLGLRHVRARFHGVNEFLASTSDPQDQTISRRVTHVDPPYLYSPNGYDAFVPDSWLGVSASVWGGGGTLVFEELDGSDWVEFGRTPVPYNPGGGSGGTVQRSGFPLGSHTIRARLLEDDYSEPSTSDPLTFESTKAPSNPTVSAPDPVEANHEFDVYASLAPPTTGVTPNGTLTLTEVETGQVVGIASGDWPQFSVHFGPRPLGTYHFVAEFSGDGNFEAQTGAPFAVHVVSDVVEATDVGVTYSTFYPVTDGYRDREKITGRRQEPASVSIRIYSPTHRLVRSTSVAKGTGLYGYQWNGRIGSTILASGRYKIVQTLTDAAGTKKVVTSYANLSHKRLVTKTAYVSKSGNLVSAKGTEPTAKVTLSSTGHYAKLTSTTGSAAVGYQFTIPSATKYKSIWFQIYTKAYFAAPGNEMGLQNFATCPYSADWNTGCFDRWHTFGFTNGGPGWAATSGSLTNNRYGRIVRGTVVVTYGTVYVYKARIKVVYQVLK